MPTLRAAQARIVGGPWRAQRRGACEAVREMGNRERIGFGPIVRIDGVEVAEDEKPGPSGPAGSTSPAGALPDSTPPSARTTPWVAQVDKGVRFVRPVGPL